MRLSHWLIPLFTHPLAIRGWSAQVQVTNPEASLDISAHKRPPLRKSAEGVNTTGWGQHKINLVLPSLDLRGIRRNRRSKDRYRVSSVDTGYCCVL